MNEILKKLQIKKSGNYSEDNNYIIDLDDSEEFGYYYSLLDKNDNLIYLEDISSLTIHNSNIIYRYDDSIEISLIADFDNDLYKIVIREI